METSSSNSKRGREGGEVILGGGEGEEGRGVPDGRGDGINGIVLTDDALF